LARAMVELPSRELGSVGDWFSRTVTSEPWWSRFIPAQRIHQVKMAVRELLDNTIRKSGSE
jgi:hypothetical protein